jgi:outer membrane protein insertion porin family
MFLRRKPVLEGARSFSEAEVLSALDLALDSPYVPRLPLVLKGKLIDFYRKRGYRFVEVEVGRRLDQEKGEVFLTLKVKEGPLVHIKEVRLHGNEKTWDWVLRQRIKLRAGDLYNEERVRESYRSLLRSGLFSQVSMETKELEGQPGEVDLDVSVSEKARYRTSFLLGYGTYELLRGKVVLEDTNLLGTGRRLRLEGRGSFRGERFSSEYTNPFFFAEPLSHQAQGFFDRRENPSFVQRQYGAETGVSYRLRDSVQSSLFYRLKQSDAVNVDNDVPPELINNVLLSSVAVSTVGDFRNSFVDPDRGSTHRLTVEYSGNALGSELDFLRYVAFTSWVFPLSHGCRWVLAGRVGAIQRLASTEAIPIQERFFLGGEYTLRSFREAKAGPKVNGEPIGGEAFTSYNVELRFPLLLLRDLHGALFGDIGSLTERVEDVGGGRYFFGVGVGLRYNTPVGPFRFDLAFNPDRKEGEDLFVLNFGLGYPF